MRLVIATAMSVFLFAACGENKPAATPDVPPPLNEPAAEVTPPAPMADARVGTMNLMCGGESFRVAFLDTHAAIVSADGATTIELPIQPAGATTEPGVTLYTDGKQSFAKSGGGDTATVIRHAVGRMAWQDCAIAQN